MNTLQTIGAALFFLLLLHDSRAELRHTRPRDLLALLWFIAIGFIMALAAEIPE